MNFLEERICKDGVVKEGNVLKVDSFLNHQMDIELFEKIGEEFKRRFSEEKIDKILTIESYFGRIVHCYGFVTNTTDNVVVTWFRKIYSVITNGFSNLLSKLDDVFGVNDTSVDAAVQTQEEINVSVNNQLVGAVEDWNTNIEVVQTGYDSAVTKAAPALGWLASLADRIFTNMGWFGNIYFLVGLISVIMLVLSKSGLARSVSRFRRNE